MNIFNIFLLQNGFNLTSSWVELRYHAYSLISLAKKSNSYDERDRKNVKYLKKKTKQS